MTRLGARFVVALFVAAALGGTAHAQLAPGYSGFSSAPTEGSENDYWWLLREMGGCLSQSKAEEARAFLATEIDTRAEKVSFDNLFNAKRNVCMRNFVKLTTVRAHIRGALAEGMYKRFTPDWTPPPASSDGWSEPVLDLHGFARCYVAGHADKAEAFITGTRLGSRDEIAAVREMAADFGPCLPQGKEVRLNPPEVRMAIAEALYHAATGTNSNGTDE